MTPTFSIIIPVYNVAPYLRECLNSVLAQTYTDWEAICVDDGSTDGSGAILDEYAAKDGRFRVMHQKNAGVSAARNAALDVAAGEWIWFVDGDDICPPDALLSFASAFDAGCSVIGGGVTYLRELGHGKFECINTSCFDRIGVVDYRETQQQLGFQRYIFSREIICKNRIRFPPISMWEDPLFLVSVLIAARKYFALHEVVYLYRVRPLSRINWIDRDGLLLRDHFKGMCLVAEICAKENLRLALADTLKFLFGRKPLNTRREYLFVREELSDIVAILKRNGIGTIKLWNDIFSLGFLPAEKALVRCFYMGRICGFRVMRMFFCRKCRSVLSRAYYRMINYVR